MTTETIEELATRAKSARKAALLSYEKRVELLHAIADAIEARSGEILAANQIDLAQGKSEGMSEPLQDRLALTPARITAIASACRDIAKLADPLGAIKSDRIAANGLHLQEITVPIGVVGMIYEARPNVTVDAAAILLASGNAVLLRGSHSAKQSNQLLVAIMREVLQSLALPEDLVQLISSQDRQSVTDLLKARGYVDLVIPRGSGALIEMVVTQAQVPTIETGAGICHIYIDQSADQAKAIPIVVNAKVDRPSVCNAVETVLIHQDRLANLLPQLLADLKREKVFFHLDQSCAVIARENGLSEPDDFTIATEENWRSEYGTLEINIKVVSDIDQALDHIEKYGTHHTEAIITEDLKASQYFVSHSDSAAIMINASTRFTDGQEMGFGAEIGISTQKLHARGPMGLAAMTTTTWVVSGTGQIR